MGGRWWRAGASLLGCLLLVSNGPDISFASTRFVYGLLSGWAKTWPQLKNGHQRSCYQYMHTALNSPVVADVSPAEYGYRICNAVESSKKCARQLQPAAVDEAVAVMLKHLDHAGRTFCDPDCPLVQAQLCYGSPAADSAQPACRDSAILSNCIQNQLTGLKCKNDSRARQFWSIHKAINHLLPCSTKEKCHTSLIRCHQVILDSALPLQLKEGYCQNRGVYENCLKSTMSQVCRADTLIVVALLEEATVLYNSTCMV